MTRVRTRFAPSPTGFQHIGGFRTALYAWLLARKHSGDFILRIEDTDKQRSVHGATKYIVDSMDWLGIDYDEGPGHKELKLIDEDTENASDQEGPFAPYIQSFRAKRHREIVEQLIESGHAYRCDCTPERLAEERKEQEARKETPGYSGYCRDRNVSADSSHVVRFRLPENISVAFDDAVRGRIVFDNPSLRDTVILKSDGLPTYHLASVVDDHDMEVSHVLRGEEWLSTTPVHILIYQALGWPVPVICHLSHILGKDGKKLGKRHGAESLSVFREEGFLPEAIINFIVRIGWSLGDGDDQEVFSREELIEKFSLNRLSKSGGTYDQDKLLWYNGIYIRKLSDGEFTKLVRPYFESQGLEIQEAKWQKLLPAIKERCKVLPDAVTIAGFLFKDSLEIDFAPVMKKKMTGELAVKIIDRVGEAMAELEVFNAESIELLLKELMEELEVKAGQIFGVVRLATTGSMQTPPLFESIEALGKELALKRLKDAGKYL